MYTELGLYKGRYEHTSQDDEDGLVDTDEVASSFKPPHPPNFER